MRLVGTVAVSSPVTRTLPEAGLRAREQLGERGLAGTVLTDDAHELTGVEGQVKVVYGGAAAVGIGKLNMVEGEYGFGILGMRTQRRCMRGNRRAPGLRWRVRGRRYPKSDTRLRRHPSKGAACQAVGLEAVENARDTRAIDADGAELIGVRRPRAARPVARFRHD